MAKDLSKYVPGSCESDIRRLKSDVGAVMSDLDEFRMRMADVGIRLDETGSQVMSAGGGFDDTDTRMSGSAVDGDERAFEVFGVEFDDSGAEKEQIDKWTVYVPSGCVQIDGVAVKFDNEVSEDRVSISPDVKGGVTLHCVVWKDKDSTAHAKICVGNGERDTLVGNIGSNGGTLYASVPFCTLSDTYEDNNQIHLGAIVLTSGGKPMVDEVSTDFKQAVDGNGNPVSEKKEVNGVQKDVPVKTDVIEIKGWHEDDPVDGATLVGLMGLPVKTGVTSKDVIVRDGTKGGELKYYSLGEVDKEALAGDPCRVASIGDGTVPGSTLSDNGLKVVKDAYVEVEYTKAGDCPNEGEVGHDDCKFTIPIIIPDGQGGTGDVTVYGTDNSSATGSVLRIASDSETNLSCIVSQGQNNEVVLTFGIRYM